MPNENISLKNEKIMQDIQRDLSCLRIDIKNYGDQNNAVEIATDDVSFFEPVWFKNEQGTGKILQGNNKNNVIKIKVIGNGLLRIFFRAQDKRFEDKRIPVWVDYKSIKIDGKEILNYPIATWHDKPFIYEMPVKDGQEIILEIEQQYHQYIGDNMKEVILKLYNNDNFIKENVDEIVKKILQKTETKISVISLNRLPNITADCFIPLGIACRPAYWLKKHGLRFCSFPFDWMMSFSLSTVISTIKNGVSSWFNQYVEDESKNSVKNRYVTDIQNHIIAMHAFPTNKAVSEYMPEFKEIFARRYNRMIDILSKSTTVCFVCNRKEYISELLVFAQELNHMYKNLRLMIICVYHDENRQEINQYDLEKNITIYYIKAYDIHKNGAEKTNPSFWIGNEDLWNEICGHLSLSDKMKQNL